MSRRHSGSSFAVSFSTRGALMPAWMVHHVATAAGVDGIDVDATTPFNAWLAARGGPVAQPELPIRSIWFSSDSIRSPRVSRFLTQACEQQPDEPPRLILLLPASGSARDLARGHQLLRGSSQFPQVAVGLPAAALRGGRPHLVQLGAIRRFAEEWDLDIAVDLSGRFDPTWEAEAAVARLGRHLRILRMPFSAPARSAVGRDRVACRALHAALDRIQLLEIALSTTSPIPFPTTPRRAANSAAQAADYIAERVALHTEALREGISRFEGSPSSLGN